MRCRSGERWKSGPSSDRNGQSCGRIRKLRANGVRATCHHSGCSVGCPKVARAHIESIGSWDQNGMPASVHFTRGKLTGVPKTDPSDRRFPEPQPVCLQGESAGSQARVLARLATSASGERYPKAQIAVCVAVCPLLHLVFERLPLEFADRRLRGRCIMGGTIGTIGYSSRCI